MEKLPIHSKEEFGDTVGADQENRRTRPTTATFLRRLLIAVVFLIGYYLLLLKPPSPACDGHHNARLQLDRLDGAAGYIQNDNDGKSLESLTAGAQKTVGQIKIPLEAHIMSKCPDAKACLQDLVLPAMEQVSNKVDFRLSFIASVSPDTEEIECKHGPGECIGDMLLLCAANLPFPAAVDDSILPPQYPRTPIVRSLGFANCLINDFTQIPEREFVHQCAMEFGIDFDALNKCASQQNDDPDDGEDDSPPLSGIALLRESATRGEKLGVKTSCTVRLDDTVWCIRDNDEWKDCGQNSQGSQPSSLVDQVEKLYKERN